MFLRRLLIAAISNPTTTPHHLIPKSHYRAPLQPVRFPKKIKKKLKKLKKPQSARFKLVQTEPNIIPHFESLLRRDAHFHFLLKSKVYIARKPDQMLCLDEAPRVYKSLGLPRGRNVVKFIRDHPLLYEFHRRDYDVLWVGFTPLMRKLLEEEKRVFDETEVDRVNVVRKLLMMTKYRRIEFRKIFRYRLLFGIGEDFRDRIDKYPEYFRVVVEYDRREVIELVKWDPSLAVSALEKEFFRDEEKVKGVFRWPSRQGESEDDEDDEDDDDDEEEEEEEEEEKMLNSLPLVSPYSDGWTLDPYSLEAEKYRLGLIHEFLSLTLEKRALIHNIVEFEELCLTNTNIHMLKQQPQTFYLAGTEMNWCIFLKDAYGEDGCLIHKDPLVLFYEKFFKYAEKKELEPGELDKVVSE